MSDVTQLHAKAENATTVLALTSLPTPLLNGIHLDDIVKIVTILYSSAGFIWILYQIWKSQKK